MGAAEYQLKMGSTVQDVSFLTAVVVFEDGAANETSSIVSSDHPDVTASAAAKIARIMEKVQ